MSHSAVQNISETKSTWIGEWDAKLTGKWLDHVIYLVRLATGLSLDV